MPRETVIRETDCLGKWNRIDILEIVLSASMQFTYLTDTVDVLK